MIKKLHKTTKSRADSPAAKTVTASKEKRSKKSFTGKIAGKKFVIFSIFLVDSSRQISVSAQQKVKSLSGSEVEIEQIYSTED